MRPRLAARGDDPSSSTAAVRTDQGARPSVRRRGRRLDLVARRGPTPSDLDRLLVIGRVRRVPGSGTGDVPGPRRPSRPTCRPPGRDRIRGGPGGRWPPRRPSGWSAWGPHRARAPPRSARRLAAMADTAPAFGAPSRASTGVRSRARRRPRPESNVGLYTISTLPDARRRGIGGAITLAVLHDAASRGARARGPRGVRARAFDLLGASASATTGRSASSGGGRAARTSSTACAG